MIHTKDLMIGNWVEYYLTENKTICSTPIQVAVITRKTISYDRSKIGSGCMCDVEEESLVGIPITEELLEKCGFCKGAYYWFDTNAVEVALVGSVAFMHFQGDEDWKVTDIQFLHQLQNAYYTLTKKELVVKL